MGVVIRNNMPRLTELKFTNRELMREIGLMAREAIIRRTLAGKDANGAAFQPYSASYAATKAKELGVSNPNLQVSGGMLRNLTIVDLTDTNVTLGWNT